MGRETGAFSVKLVRLVLSLSLFVVASGLCAEEKESPAKEETTNSETEEKVDAQATKVEDESELTLEKILELGADEKSYSNSKTCVDSRKIDDYEVLNARMVILEMRDDSKYLITTKSHCHGMRRHATMSTQQKSSFGFCRGDTIRWGVVEFGSVTWGTPCWVHAFEPVSEYQVSRLKEGIKAGRVD